jgi:hypothetical protein
VRKRKSVLTRSGRERVGSTEHGTTGLDSVETLNNHSNYGPRVHVFDEAGEEGLASEVLVVYKKSGTQRKDRGDCKHVRTYVR